MSPSPSDAGARALSAAERGDFREVPAAFEALQQVTGDGNEGDRALALALRAVGWVSEPERWSPPTTEEVEALFHAPGAHAVAARVCVWMEKAMVARFDEASLAVWVDVHGRLVQEDGDELPALWLRTGRAWLALCGDRPVEVPEQAAEIEAAASRAGDGALVVDAASLRALALLLTDRLEEATGVARRASRMARTEGLPVQEYLAHLVLARVRRLHGRPAMATRILSSLATVAPRTWWGWIAWEQLLSAGPEVAGPLVEALATERGPIQRTASGLHDILVRARSAERAEIVRAFGDLRSHAPTFGGVSEELSAVRVALDPDADPAEAPPALAAWIRGEVDAMAPGLPGLCIAAGQEGSANAPAAWVVADPGRAPRRVTRAGVRLAERAIRVDHTRMRVGREDTALAVLALAGPPGLAIEECFSRVYGFDYEPELHEGTFRVLIHRLKGRLGEAGRIAWGGGRVVLSLEGPLIVADPRCARATDDRVMLALAHSGTATARDIAAALRIPLRTVQSAIRELVEEGACRPEQDGRIVRYVVEDTTFSEPTRH